VLAEVAEQPPLEVPVGWSAQVLLLSGLSPVLSHAAALCKAARAAGERARSCSIDFNASLHAWRDATEDDRHGLREVDAARCASRISPCCGWTWRRCVRLCEREPC